jgi:hypothetical protein
VVQEYSQVSTELQYKEEEVVLVGLESVVALVGVEVLHQGVETLEVEQLIPGEEEEGLPLVVAQGEPREMAAPV